MRPGGKIHGLLRLEGKAVNNRLDGQVCDIAYLLGVSFKLQFACPGTVNHGTEKDPLSVAASAFPGQSFSMLLRNPRAPNIRVPARFHGNEAA